MLYLARSGVLAVCVAAAAGCTDTSRYVKAIDGFAYATQRAEDAVQKLSAPTEGERERLLIQAAMDPANIQEREGCTTASTGCELWVTDSHQQERPLTSRESAPQALALLGDMSAYAAALKAIAVANREQEINVALNSVTDSVGAIAQQFDRRVSPEAKVGNQLIAFAVSGYLNKLKLEALQDATSRGEEALPEIEKLLATTQTLLTEREIGWAYNRFVKAKSDLPLGLQDDQATRVTKLATYERAAQELDALLKLRADLKSDGPSAFRSMREAHTKLFEALHSKDEKTFDSAMAEIDFFLRETLRFAEIVDQLELGGRL